MNNRTVPHHIQSAVVTQTLIELIEKHPELLQEVNDYLSQLPEPVGQHIFNKVKYRSPSCTVNELASLWTHYTGTAQSTAQVSNRRRVNIQRSRR